MKCIGHDTGALMGRVGRADREGSSNGLKSIELCVGGGAVRKTAVV